MKVAVISPHLDDAVFSVAEHMLSRPDWEFTIVTPFGGQPSEEPHRSKYLILHDEHQRVCEFAGWDVINLHYLDDAARPTSEKFGPWWTPHQMEHQVDDVLADLKADQVWWPVGIHHPDHRFFRRTRNMVATHFYEELPYRVLYPEGLDYSLHDLQGYDPSNLNKKRELCRMYASQVDDQLERCLYAPERLWVAR